MKTKVFLFIGIILVAAGLIVSFVAAASSGFNSEKLGVTYEATRKETEIVDEYNSLYIDVDCANVVLTRGSTSKVNHFESKYSYFDVKVTDSKLVVQEIEKEKKPWYIDKINLGFDKYHLLEIVIPTTLACDIEINNAIGKVKADGDFNNIKLDVVTSEIELNNIYANNIIIDSTTGDIKANNVYSNEFIVETTTAEVIINNINSPTLKINSTTGDINVNNGTFANIEISITTGEVELDYITTSNMNVEATTGDIDARLFGIKSEYTILVSKVTGGSNVSDQTGTTSKLIKLKTTTGDIEVNFI